MSLLLIVASLVAAPAAAAQRPPAPPARTSCTAGEGKVRTTGRARQRPLGEMPPAIALKAVWRAGADGCPRPLTVSDYVAGDQR